MSIVDVAKLLSNVGGQQLSEDDIRADLKRGAPTNADGTISLVNYAAWLVRQAANRSVSE